MNAEEPLARLADALGDTALEWHDPVWVDGVAVRATLVPADGAALATTLAALGRHGLAGLPRGGGTQMGIGNAPQRADAFVSTHGLRGVDRFEPAEGVCHAGAGTPLALLHERVCSEGWELPLDVYGDAATLGGALATAAVGPRAQGFGLPRDVVLGLEVALATGERTHCGGRVVKNVSGYDLAKLYTGSFGTLGVIEGAWLRLRPLPECSRVFEVPAAPLEQACARGVAASRRASVRACALLSHGAALLRGVIEIAGDGPSVERDARWLAGELGAEPGDGEALARVQHRQRAACSEQPLRFRLGVLPTRLESVVRGLASAGAALLAYPGLHLVYASFAADALGDPAAVERAFAAARSAARAGGGALLCEAAPAEAKRGRDVHACNAALKPLMAALKGRFDPAGVLSPGRFAGGI
jgi:glycolate dehydrogenase FAD-binding subunit